MAPVEARSGHEDAGYRITNEPPGAESAITLTARCFVLLLFAPGVFSLDALIF